MTAYMIEELVLNEDVRKEMENYRYYRIEYGGVNEESRWTGSIWLPPWVGEDEILAVINREEK